MDNIQKKQTPNYTCRDVSYRLHHNNEQFDD